jgi:hypothetical protein
MPIQIQLKRCEKEKETPISFLHVCRPGRRMLSSTLEEKIVGLRPYKLKSNYIVATVVIYLDIETWS